MRGWLWIVIGALVTIVGSIWALQGLNVLGGSVMSGKTLWAVVGPIVAFGGVIMVVVGIRAVRKDSPAGRS